MLTILVSLVAIAVQCFALCTLDPFRKHGIATAVVLSVVLGACVLLAAYVDFSIN